MKTWPRKREYLYAAIAAALAIIYAIVGTMDYQDALIAERARFAPQDRPAAPGQVLPPLSEPSPAVLSHPIPYRAVVCQSGRCAYYIGKDSQ